MRSCASVRLLHGSQFSLTLAYCWRCSLVIAVCHESIRSGSFMRSGCGSHEPARHTDELAAVAVLSSALRSWRPVSQIREFSRRQAEATCMQCDRRARSKVAELDPDEITSVRTNFSSAIGADEPERFVGLHVEVGRNDQDPARQTLWECCVHKL